VLVDAPVSGSEGPARAGELVVLASGPHEVRDVLAPAFGVLGRATAWLGPAGHGTRAKPVLNNWLADLTEATAETLSFARRLDLDPAAIVDLLQSSPLGAPYAAKRPAACWPGTSAPRSRSSTPSRTPNSPRRPAAPRSPSPGDRYSKNPGLRPALTGAAVSARTGEALSVARRRGSRFGYLPDPQAEIASLDRSRPLPAHIHRRQEPPPPQ
jgi:hypothetical protein